MSKTASLVLVFIFLLSLTTNVLANDSYSKTLTQMILQSIEKNAERPAFRHRAAENDWPAMTFSQWHLKSEKLASWLIQKGLQKGDRVGIMNYNNPSWPVIDLGVQLAGGVLVPLYPTLTGPQHNYILDDTDMTFLFIMDQIHLNPIKVLPGALDNCEVVGIFSPENWPRASRSKLAEVKEIERPKKWDDDIIILDTILKESIVTDEIKSEIDQRVADTRAEEMVTICYTSGTTAAPPTPGQIKVYPGKGVMLSHRNIVSNVLGVIDAVSAGPSDVFFSILPLAHMFERTGGYYTAVMAGSTICYSRSPSTFAIDIGEVKPTIFTSVPLLFERLYKKAAIAANKKFIGKVLSGAMKITEFFGGNGERLKKRIVGKLLKHILGPNVRFAVSGGAALKRELAELFQQYAGVTILEGYGLTETSPVLTCNRLESFKFGTVGFPLQDIEIRLADDGEILARGPCIMMGYLNMPEKTAEVIDDEGFFHTGDLGAYDINGSLKITGRKKLLFKLKNGKYISPETIEKCLKHELVAQSMVIGANEDYAAALIFPEFEALRTLAKALQIDGSIEEICANPEVLAVYKEFFIEAQGALAKFERARKFLLVPYELSVEKGELTPTFKVKRGVVTKVFEAEINSLF